MKNKLLSLLLIATTICAIPAAVGQTKDTLTNKYLDRRDDGLFYQEQNKKPFNGVILLDDYNKEVIEYVKGEKVHHTIWYENGQKESNINYIDGQPEGEQAKWYEDGQKKYECNVVSGKLDGLLSVWYENGQKHIESTVFYQESKLMRNESLQDWAGLLVTKGGTVNVWQPNGKKIGFAKANLVDGKYFVLHETWYEKGQKKSEFNYLNGQSEGEQSNWYENGQKKSKDNYLDGQREGKQAKWYEDGNKEYEANYLNGKKDGIQKTWHKNGQMASKTNYKDENKEGLWTAWYENGKIKVKSNYKNGKREGEQIEWDVNGKQINKENKSRTNDSSSKDDNTAYATQFFSLDDSKSKFKIHKANDYVFDYTIDGEPRVSAQEPMIRLMTMPFYLGDEVLEEGQLKGWVDQLFNTLFGAEDLDIIYESELGANGYDSYSVLKKKSLDKVNTYLYFQSIVYKGNEVQIIVSQEGGEFDSEEIRKLIRTIKMR